MSFRYVTRHLGPPLADIHGQLTAIGIFTAWFRLPTLILSSRHMPKFQSDLRRVF
jgi:hypothetical protein